MKHARSIRNYALLGLGAAGLVLMLVPSQDAAFDTEAQAPRFSLATSKELSAYLEARLSPPAPRQLAAKELWPDDEPGSTPLVVDPLSAISAVAVDDAVPGELQGTVAPTAPAGSTAIDVAEFEIRPSTAVNVRAGPGTSTKRLFVLKPGTAVRIERTQGNWAEIATADGETGWAYAPLLETVDSPQENSGTARATTPDGYTMEESTKVDGPVDSSPSITDERDEPRPKATKGKAFLLANTTVMRSSPTRGSSKLTVIPGGSRVLVSGWDGGWARVVLADGSSGWIKVR